jgi:hypothetical protein
MTDIDPHRRNTVLLGIGAAASGVLAPPVAAQASEPPADNMEARLAKLEARVRELEDEREIGQLLSRYGYDADCHRHEAWVDLFTDDGVFDLSASAGGKTNVVRLEGKAALADYISKSRPANMWGKLMHCQGNNVVTHINGDEAVVDSYSVVIQNDGQKISLVSAGNNQWRLKKVGGKWLFKERRRREIGDADYIRNIDATPA